MDILVAVLVIAAIAVFFYRRRAKPISLAHLPERFVVLDLETTGLTAGKHEIIEIGAIRVNRDSNIHDTFQSFIKPTKKIPKKIIEITGITQEMVDAEGTDLKDALQGLAAFVGNLRLVTFNAEFDCSFLEAATEATYLPRFQNPVSCALNMARRAWPGRKTYRLAELAKDGGLPSTDTHRALGDCQRTLIVYTAASAKLRTLA